ncbi:MAG: chromosomal replication initiator protein DnaA [Deltaproteobacteria bacterium]|nr:chromosomal replication initiator protein DnaA [Deltaproteobacteria bacterium]
MEQLWTQLKGSLKSQMPPHRYQLWIEPIKFVDGSDGKLTIGCPNRFFINWIRDNYLPVFQEELSRAVVAPPEIRLEVLKPKDIRPRKDSAEPSSRTNGCQLILPAMSEPISCRPLLNPAFTFDRFVTGASNHFAYNAAKNVSEGMDQGVSLVYLLSSTGLGKSHLCQAISREILSREPQSRVHYLTTEDFINEMILSLKLKRMDTFKEKYRRCCDVLLLEEIHFLGGKSKTQDEFAFTLDALINSNKKVVLTSSKLPKDISDMHDGLRSRLNSGLMVRIGSPDFETRVRILDKKARTFKVPTPREILEFVAEHIRDDVRELESSLICLNAKSSLEGRPINLELAQEVVQGFVENKKSVSAETIQEFVAGQFNLDVEDLKSKSRKANIVFPRSVAMHLCRKYTNFTLDAIGKSFNRNHASVLYALNSLQKKMRKNYKTKHQVNLLERKLKDLFLAETLRVGKNTRVH